MSGFGLYILTSICLILIIEGLIYALFTDNARKLMTIVLTMPDAKLRGIGFMMAAAGFIILGTILSLPKPS